ncbi:DUF3667 domain-containing protein [Galbibacter pacificus]|uniref:DUF3667 domain-containing protein n=1 Tax=Galbibacter pacificus TaxID=2996052 RepID=A0ABT6FLW4_9FLAO|nr:DUF3667 domain-containing protein [Galbibacter pacificus]MDG3580769.1 DUF3667 domain-containing protein [Galbibacter pacificus]MDG3584247.1 DUF3667 domain-containing protein [Galbibacter pacificus]
MDNTTRSELKYRGTQCLNCKIPLESSDRFCPNCGQLNSTKKISVFDIIEELMGSVFSYDSKLRKTLTALILRPGKITSEFIKGKRATYTNPFRFFFSITILYFLMISYNSDFSSIDEFWNNELLQDSLHIETTLQQIKDASTNKEDTALIDSLITKYSPKEKNDNLDLDPKAYFAELEQKPMFNTIYDKTVYFFNGIQAKKYRQYEDALSRLKIESTLENKTAFSIAKSSYKSYHHPGSFFENLVSKLPFVIFFYLPVFSIFIWLVYPKRKFYYIDHLIFSFHTQTLFILLLIITFLIKWFFNINLHWIALIVFLLYLYKSMRGFYKEKRFKTIVKFIYLNTIFLILALFSFSMILFVSALTY